jgi:hypothetical protein
LAEEWNLQVVGKILPPEDARGAGSPPEDPAGEEAVVGCLNEGRSEELLSLLTFERNSQGAAEVLQETAYGIAKAHR